MQKKSLFGAALLLLACGPAPGMMTAADMSPLDGGLGICPVPAPTACPSPVPHFADVQPIIERRCVSCHNGNGPEWPLKEYRQVADWQDSVHDRVLNCTMPPPEAMIPMTARERTAILEWIKCGFLE